MKQKNEQSKFILILCIFIVVLTITGSALYFIKLRPVSSPPEVLPQSGLSSPDEHFNRYFSEISKLIQLPADEKPTLVNITDVTRVNNQPFFTNAQNGDVVLIFSQNKKAYLYRPSIKKLIEVSPISFSPTPTINPQPTP